MLKRQNCLLRSQKGMAVLELVPTLFIYMLLINFSLGFFGVVHSGILHSIAARNYTFETFFFKSNLVYHLRADPNTLDKNNFEKKGFRYSGIVSESTTNGNSWVAPARPIAFTSQFGGTDQEGVDLASRSTAGIPGELDAHSKGVRELDEAKRNDSVAVKSVWIKSLYGICMNSLCGDP